VRGIERPNLSRLPSGSWSGLVDQCDPRCTASMPFGEVTAPPQGGSQQVKYSGVTLDPWTRWGRLLHCCSACCFLQVPTGVNSYRDSEESTLIVSGDLFYSGTRSAAAQYFANQSGLRIRALIDIRSWIVRHRELHVYSHDILGIEVKEQLVQIPETAQ
jgi:hypothetical protein